MQIRLFFPAFLLLVACDTFAPHEATGFHETASDLRPDDAESTDLYTFEPGETVERWDSPGGSFRVHFTRSGKNAVPARDNDVDGVPDFVEEVGLYADAVDVYYSNTLGLRRARSDEAAESNGGDGRFDFYLLDFGGAGDGAYRTDLCDGEPRTCAGHMVIENDYAGYGYPSTATAHAILVSHEYFHAIQAAYAASDASQGESVLREGTAVWATEQFDPNLNDFERFIDGYLDNTDRSLDKPLPGPVDAFSYGSAIFFQHLSERFGNDIIRRVWEERHTSDRWLDAVATLLADEYETPFDDVFTTFVAWNHFTGPFADASRSYARGGRYPRIGFGEEALPLQESEIRLSYASSRTWAVEGGRDFEVRLVPAPGDARESSAMRMLVAVESANRIVSFETLLPGDASYTVEAATADRVLLTVVNTDLDGEWRRPTLCAGSTSAVEACVADALAMPDAGPVDVPDAGEMPSDAGDPGTGGDTGCGCHTGDPALLAIFGGALFAYRRRR